jgi:hypothetical protein
MSINPIPDDIIFIAEALNFLLLFENRANRAHVYTKNITCEACNTVCDQYFMVVECDGVPIFQRCIVCYEKMPYIVRARTVNNRVVDHEAEYRGWWITDDRYDSNSKYTTWSNDVYNDLVSCTLLLRYEKDAFWKVKTFLENRAARKITKFIRYYNDEFNLRPGGRLAKAAEANFYKVRMQLEP